MVPKDKIISLVDILNVSKETPIMVLSGCSRHMMGERYIFQSLKQKKGGKAIFKGNQHDQIGSGQVSLKPFVY